MKWSLRRKGVASIVGMLFMVVVFMLAIGSQVYVSSLQAQASQSASAAELRVSQRSAESMAFTSPAAGLTVTDTGPTGENVVGMVMKFENGTSYVLGNDTTPRFDPALVTTGEGVPVGSLVPAGVCSPGTATCLSKFDTIVGDGQVSGRGVGLVTSLGNTFWYVPSTAAAQAPDPSYYVVKSTQSTTSPTYVGVQGLSFDGAPNGFYVVQLFIAFAQSSSTSSMNFAFSLPSGATYLFCGGLDWANPLQGTTDLPPGNMCYSQPNASLGTLHNTQTYCVQQGSGMCELTGTAFVTFGPAGGTLQLMFEGSSADTATVIANSVMVVTQE